MRTTLDLPDPLFRSLKARAAMEGSSLKDFVVRLVQRELSSPATPTSAKHSERSPLPVLVSGELGLTAEQMSSNAALYELLHADDDAAAIALMRGTSAPTSAA
jgi:hypothetical protein